MAGTSRYPQEYSLVQRVGSGQLNPIDALTVRKTPFVFADPRDWLIQDDFLYNAMPAGPWAVSTNGAGAAVQPRATFADPTNSGSVGVVHISTGTTAAGSSGFYTYEQGITLAEGQMRLGFRMTVDLLSTAGDEFGCSFGFGDVFSAAAGLDATDGAYFRYQRTVDGDVWACLTANNGTRTKTVTAQAVNRNQMQRFDIQVSEDGGTVWFFIDGAQVALHTTNIATGSGRQCGIGAKIVKTVGATSISAAFDYAVFNLTQSNARS